MGELLKGFLVGMSIVICSIVIIYFLNLIR